MSINISMNEINISVAEHPTKEQRIHVIEPISYNMPTTTNSANNIATIHNNNGSISRTMFSTRKEKVKQDIELVLKEFGVVGFVVGWPLEPSGLPGASCGRVLHLLDYLADARSGRLISKSRPMTLWDQRIFNHDIFDEIDKPQDKWGRSAAFCQYASGDEAYETNMYISSHGKDHALSSQPSSPQAALNEKTSRRILKHYLHSHYQENEDGKYIRKLADSSSKSNSRHHEHINIFQQYECRGACIESSLL